MLAIATTASTSFLAVSGLIPSQDSRNFAQAKKIQPLATEAAEFGLETLPMDDGSMSEAAPSLFDVRQLAGVSSPLGFWDPAGFSQEASEGKIRFYREVEIKHGRLAMLSSVGFVVAEQFHPLFGGMVDVPSYVAFQETPLQTFWPAVVLAISFAEVFSVFTFNSPVGGEMWTIRSDHTPGDLGWDPLNIKPDGAAALMEMQTRELNNGRLAMIGITGMVVQELVTGQKLF